MAKNLVRASKAKDDLRVPVATSTLYKWRHTKKFPKLFVKLGGCLFVDLDQLDRIIESLRIR